MNKIKFLVLFVAVLLLSTAVKVSGIDPMAAAAVDPAANAVAWADSDGEGITHSKRDVTAYIYVKDDGVQLETSGSGTATFAGTVADTNGLNSPTDYFSIATGQVSDAGTTSTASSFTLTAAGYESSSPATTPLTGDPTVTSGGSSAYVVSSNTDTGRFSLLGATAANATTTATFSFHKADSYAAGANRAKVTSSSDLTGEWIGLTEVTAAGTTSTNATSRLFFGAIDLKSDAEFEGTNSDGVWVEDTDTVTVTYYDASGNILNTATLTIDSSAPTISAVSPEGGTVTTEPNPQVLFDATDTGSGLSSSGISLTINGTSTAGLTPYPIADGYRGQFITPTAWKTAFEVVDSTAFDLVITATDGAGNVGTETVSITIDETSPTVLSAVTGAAADAVVVTFSEVLTSVEADGSDFTIAGTAASSAALDADNNAKVNLTAQSNLDANAKPEVAVAGTLSDAAGNSVATGSKVTASDGIDPTNTVTLSAALLANEGVLTITIDSDEKLASGGLDVSISGVSGAASAGTVTMSSAVPRTSTGSETMAAADTSGQYGVTVRGSDGPNTANNLTAVAAEAITFSTAGANTVTLANGPIGDANFDGAINALDFTITPGAGSVTTTAADASARTLTFTADATAATGGTATVAYSYVATDVFEVDASAPTVAVDQAGATITDRSPFLRMLFDEDEYVGDSYTTVTVTKAELTDPDGVATDILADLVTSDNKEYLYAASNLALGAYTLTLSATDTAGNALTDNATAFTVAKRTQTIALRPGWNLISLADAPDSSAVNDVFSDAEVTVVMAYSATTPGLWTSATRGDDGLLSGSLETADGSTGYWVFATDFVAMSVDIPGLTAGSPGTPITYRLASGWNLIPIASSDLSIDDRDADDYLTGIDWSRIYGYDNATNAFESILPDTNNNDVDLGSGYWIYVNAAGTLVP